MPDRQRWEPPVIDHGPLPIRIEPRHYDPVPSETLCRFHAAVANVLIRLGIEIKHERGQPDMTGVVEGLGALVERVERLERATFGYAGPDHAALNEDVPLTGGH